MCPVGDQQDNQIEHSLRAEKINHIQIQRIEHLDEKDIVWAISVSRFDMLQIYKRTAEGEKIKDERTWRLGRKSNLNAE